MGDPFVRRLTIMRHAERVDFTFGAWIPSAFNEQGVYTRRNLNMPVSVPKRSGGPWDFFKDCPLTQIGVYQATLTGEAMKDCGMKYSHVFCSPSLRCLETCHNVLKASKQIHLPVNVEPGLFEWLSWYRDGMPAWMTLEEFRDCGFNVSLDYKPVISALDLSNTKETSEEYYMRSLLVTKKLLHNYSGNLFFVGHASTLDTCSRQLTGRSPRNMHDLQNLVMKVPYASVAIVEELPENQWKLTDVPFPPLMHTNNLSFEWRILT